MKNIINFLRGKKTYITCIAMLAYVAIGYYLGKGFDQETFFNALALAGIRNAL